MNKLTVKKGNVSYEFAVDYVKYCLGNNYVNKHEFKNIIFEVFNGSKSTEYAMNFTGTSVILFNDHPILSKFWNMYYVNENYSINSEMKLTAKSLSSLYFETIFNDMDHFDTINTLNILMESLAQEIESENWNTRFISLTPKQLVKLMTPIYLLDENQANEYDLDYEQSIIMQLDMIKLISENIKTKKHLCLIEIPLLTENIQKAIEQLKDNCITIVMLSGYSILIDVEDVYLFEQDTLDLSDELLLFQMFNDKGISTIEEAKNIMKNELNKQVITLKSLQHINK